MENEVTSIYIALILYIIVDSIRIFIRRENAMKIQDTRNKKQKIGFLTK